MYCCMAVDSCLKQSQIRSGADENALLSHHYHQLPEEGTGLRKEPSRSATSTVLGERRLSFLGQKVT